MRSIHRESHLVARIGWLRAAVLGANDGIISTASLVLGVASAASGGDEALVAGIAGLVAGAMSMAAGEYVSVSSQADTEKADLDRERAELRDDPEYETEELAQIYAERGAGRYAAQLCLRGRHRTVARACARYDPVTGWRAVAPMVKAASSAVSTTPALWRRAACRQRFQ